MHDDKLASDYNLEGGSTLHLVSIRLFLCHCDESAGGECACTVLLKVSADG